MDHRRALLILGWIALTAGLIVLCTPQAWAQSSCGPYEAWVQAPTENVDGTPLTDLAFLNLHFGRSSSGPFDTAFSFPFTEPGAVTCLALPRTLEPGVWYIRATATDSEGNTSAYSARTASRRQPDRTPARITIE